MSTATAEVALQKTGGGIEGPGEPRDTGEADRIGALDGMRGFAVLWVMLHHFTHGAEHHNPVLGAFFHFCRYGYWGVDVFFVLSGFLITGILYDSKQSDNYFRAFYARRSLRIFPLYYFVLFGVFVVLPLLHPFTAQQQEMAGRQGWLWTYTGNIAMVVHNGPIFDAGSLKLLHFWSLAIEEQFYLVWPAVVLLLSRKGLMRMSLFLVVLAAASRALLDRIGIGQPQGSFFTLSRVDGLALGSLAALLARGPGGFAELVPKARWLAIISAVLLGGALFATARNRLGEVPKHLIPPLRLCLFAGSLVLAVAARGWIARIFSMRWLIFLGKYSYALYVFHYMMMPMLDRYAGDAALTQRFGSFIVGMTLHLIICIAASIIVALSSWHLLEKHFLKLKRHFVPSRHGRAAQGERRAVLV